MIDPSFRSKTFECPTHRVVCKNHNLINWNVKGKFVKLLLFSKCGVRPEGREGICNGGGDKRELEVDRRVENKQTNNVDDEEKGNRALITQKRQHNGRMEPLLQRGFASTVCVTKNTTIRFIQTLRCCLYNNNKGKYNDKTTRVRAITAVCTHK